MSDIEAPLTPDERLAIAALYTNLVMSQNRPSSGQLGSESPCYPDLNICGPETLSHNEIPVMRVREGLETEKAC